MLNFAHKKLGYKFFTEINHKLISGASSGRFESEIRSFSGKVPFYDQGFP